MPNVLLHFDPAHGASGDMVLGALLDLGVPPEVVDRAVAAVGVDARLDVSHGFRHGVRGTRVRFVDARGAPVDPLETGAAATPLVVRTSAHTATHDHTHYHDHDHDHDHSSAHPHHDVEGNHTPYAEVVRRLTAAPLPSNQRDMALAIFRRLGEAEARIHGIALEEVALHEVAQADSLADMVGAAAAICHLAPSRITCGTFGVGHGSVRMAHGVLPGPGPATGLLLLGAPVKGLPDQMETVTPTGAAVLTTVAHAFGPVPAMTLTGQGHGLGAKDPPERANLLRAWLGEAGRTAHAQPPTRLVELTCNVDDGTPQQLAFAVEALLHAGALDAWVTPVVMKKGRAAWMLSALGTADAEAALARVMMVHTPTLGVRTAALGRHAATRAVLTVTTPLGPVRFKVSRLDGEELHAAPEHDDCAALAVRLGMPLAQVTEQALAAYAAQGAVRAPQPAGDTEPHPGQQPKGAAR